MPHTSAGDEHLDEIALRWVLRDIRANRHHFMKPSEAKLQRLRELGWITETGGELHLSEAGHDALR